MKLIFGVLNYKVFVPLIEKRAGQKTDDALLYLKRKRKGGGNIMATGQKVRDGFVVFKGSYISEDELQHIPNKIRKLRAIAKIDEKRILQEDLVFSSPSYASSFVVGGSSNGLTEWKTKDGIPLKNIISSENEKE